MGCVALSNGRAVPKVPSRLGFVYPEPVAPGAAALAGAAGCPGGCVPPD